VGQYIAPELSYQVMKGFREDLKKIVVLFNDREANSKAAADKMEQEAKKQGTQCELVPFDILPGENKTALVPGSLGHTVTKILEKTPDMIFMTSDTLNTNYNKEIIEEFVKQKNKHAAPIFTTLELQLSKPKSCLFGLFISFNVMGVMAASKAEAVLFKNKKIEEVPYEVGSQMNLVIRGDTMRALQTYPALKLLETADIFDGE
jgi:ABC-type uncharacterized transport system substrate-binding protein